MVAVMLQSALSVTVLILLIAGGNAQEKLNNTVSITREDCDLVYGAYMTFYNQCLPYFEKKTRNGKPPKSEPGPDYDILKTDCNKIGTVVGSRCVLNLTALDDCAFAVEKPLMTPSGCIANYNEEDCRGFKQGNLCVVIKKAPEVEVKPGPKPQEHIFDNAVIIPEAPYMREFEPDNGFKYLTKSENYYVQSVCGQAKAPRARIVNGEIAAKGQFPWVVDLGCTGTLISPRHVLTAGHCFNSYTSHTDNACSPDPEKSIVNKTIRYGGVCRSKIDNDCPNGADTKTATINRVMYAHDNPSECTYLNDIAIVLLNEDVEFNDYVKPICLGKIAHDNFVNVQSVGVGQVTNTSLTNVLRYMKSSITSIDQTHREVDSITPGKSVCFGDSGGPLQASFNGSSRTYLAGILTRMTINLGVCAPNTPATYTFVPAYVKWVCQQTGVCELD